MKKGILTILFINISFIGLFAQGLRFDWAKSFGSTAIDYTRSVATDSDGNIYCTGLFYDSIDINPDTSVFTLYSHGDKDIFVAKFDAIGNLLWGFDIGGPYQDVGMALTIDADDDLYVTGYFMSTVDFDPSPNLATISAIQGKDIFVCKFTSSGSFLWAKSMGGINSESSWSMVVDDEKNIYTTGYYSGQYCDFDPGPGTYYLDAVSYEDVFISKLDSLGNFVWAKSHTGSSTNQSFSLCVDIFGNVYTTGVMSGTFDFDSNPFQTYNLTSNGLGDAFISKLNSAGSLQWAINIGSTSHDCGFAIIPDELGNIYSTGLFRGTVDFDPGADTCLLTTNGQEDVFVMKIDTAGELVWAKSFGSSQYDNGQALAIDGINNIYCSGLFNSTADFDPGPGIMNLTSNGDEDIFLVKLNSSGDFISAKSFGGSANEENSSLAITSNNDIVIAGIYKNSVDFDPGFDTTLFVSQGSTDCFISKFSPCAETYTNLSVSECVSYTSPAGNILTNTGTYTEILANFAGCDSIITIDLTILSPITQITATVCDTFISPSGNSVWTNSGTYSDTIFISGQCDSIFNIDLTVISGFYQSITEAACHSYTFNGTVLTSSGTYYESFTNSAGCDSIYVLNLTIIEVDTSIAQNANELTANATGAAYQWIDCQNGNAPISGATNQSFTPTVNGSYAVIVSENGCTDTSSCYTISTIGMDESDYFSDIKIYPNPAQDKLFIDFGKEFGAKMESRPKCRVELLNCAGLVVLEREIRNQSNIELDLHNFPAGEYFVRIFDGEMTVFVEELVKE